MEYLRTTVIFCRLDHTLNAAFSARETNSNRPFKLKEFRVTSVRGQIWVIERRS
jgi:hypothetical protein